MKDAGDKQMKLFYGYCLIALGFFFYSMVIVLLAVQVHFSLETFWNALLDPVFLLAVTMQSLSVMGLGIPFHLIGRRMVRQAQKRY